MATDRSSGMTETTTSPTSATSTWKPKHHTVDFDIILIDPDRRVYDQEFMKQVGWTESSPDYKPDSEIIDCIMDGMNKCEEAIAKFLGHDVSELNRYYRAGECTGNLIYRRWYCDITKMAIIMRTEEVHNA